MEEIIKPFPINNIQNKSDEIRKSILERIKIILPNVRRGYINVAMRVGKTKLAIDAIREMGCKKVLVCYPDNKLKYIWQNEVEKWGGLDAEIKYSNYRSIDKYENEIFDIVVLDEFHKCSDRETYYAKQIGSKSMYCLGLSGTVDKATKIRWEPFLTHMVTYGIERAIRDGLICDYKLTIHVISLNNTLKRYKRKNGFLTTEKGKYDSYTAVIDNLTSQGMEPGKYLYLYRNRIISCSVNKIKYTRHLLETTLKDGRYLIFGGLISMVERFGIPIYHSKNKNETGSWEDFQEKKINHLGLVGIGKVGYTFKDLDGVVMTNFTHNSKETTQIMSRALMADYNGKIADLHIVTTNEPAELRKVERTLQLMNLQKAEYIYPEAKLYNATNEDEYLKNYFAF
jgi:superfamily II DNA or RNA helicase